MASFITFLLNSLCGFINVMSDGTYQCIFFLSAIPRNSVFLYVILCLANISLYCFHTFNAFCTKQSHKPNWYMVYTSVELILSSFSLKLVHSSFCSISWWFPLVKTVWLYCFLLPLSVLLPEPHVCTLFTLISVTEYGSVVMINYKKLLPICDFVFKYLILFGRLPTIISFQSVWQRFAS